ncbi:hypothetical protein FRC14_003566 [Serendipita sp. 396]|nr:hypothetical protein FRC14_003566 [Serendipita sp. 396]KAG8788233.1 hypothetical protein FRC15_005403 [Serendipita sp. 397]KAG8803437.1 hypothetical protein FRC16_005369 [Serendipita sp. 398]KAG8827056.1 hypothetical protein FRC19_005760 [Serendipita sp. 401]KAG8838651.1 hypothetical protein FRC18_003476 [Serendipita sp. 400]KAG8860233.1 hypothetical protein FRB91_004317 [Serendipita sp. 411]KAG8874374.1 hypothetical protein FRC20_006140 [Serendipita sp. 405]KAG9057528.1 hypothetical prot
MDVDPPVTWFPPHRFSAMGKWTIQHTEDILLAKLRTAIHDAIELHKSEKRQEGEARPVTFDEFVQQFDPKDSFTAKLMEVLVKEYSERRAKSTPVDRLYQIATRTSLALGAMGREATVYDNCRPSRWGRSRNRIISSLRQQLEADRQGRNAQDQVEDETSTTTRDEQFQAALEELEDGEFGAYWNSNLNDVYHDDLATQWRRRGRLRPILHDITMDVWPITGNGEDAGGAIASGSSSLASDAEGQFPVVDPYARIRQERRSNTHSNRWGTSNLFRRGSIRRSWYGRHPSEDDLGQPDRISREGEGSSIFPPVDLFSGFVGPPPQVDPFTGHRSLRRGGLRPPETLLRTARISTPANNTNTESPNPHIETTNQTRLVAFAPTDHDRPPPSIESLTAPRWTLRDQANLSAHIWEPPWSGETANSALWRAGPTRGRLSPAITPSIHQNESVSGLPQSEIETSREPQAEAGDGTTQ